MGNATFKELLSKRKDRAIAVVLGFKDSSCDEFLPEDISRGLRSVILDQINEYHDLVLDVMKSLENDSVIINEAFVERLELLSERVMSVGGDA